MTQEIERSNSKNLDRDESNAKEEYQALVRALRRKRGFGLFFVQASPAKGQKVLASLRRDLPQKQIVETALERTDEQLFEKLEVIWEKEKVDIFWIEGLEQPLLEYEDMQRLAGWNEQDLMTYSWKDVPPILAHLNLSRERFEARFDCAVVFVVPLFVVKYLLRRAGDFFDWKSGFFGFSDNLNESVQRVVKDADYSAYLILNRAERTQKILQIKDLLDESKITVVRKALLLREVGELFELGKEYEQALVSYSQAIQLKPDFGEAWNDRGNVLKKLGRYETAIESYQKAIELSPKNAPIYNNLGNAYSEWKKYEQAIVVYQEAIELNPEEAITYYNLGNAYLDQKDYEQAIAYYKRAIGLDSKDANAHNNLGVAYYEAADYAHAISSYQRAISLNPESPYPYDGLGNLYQKQKHYEQATLLYQKAIELDPELAYPYDSLGNLYQELKLYDQAITAYQSAIELDAKFPAPYNGLGIVYSHQNCYEEATTAFNQAIELNPGYSAAYNNLGIIHVYEKEYEKAIVIFHKALELSADKGLSYQIGTIFYNLSIAYANLSIACNNQDASVQAFLARKKAIELNPKYKDAFQISGNIHAWQVNSERKDNSCLDSTASTRAIAMDDIDEGIAELGDSKLEDVCGGAGRFSNADLCFDFNSSVGELTELGVDALDACEGGACAREKTDANFNGKRLASNSNFDRFHAEMTAKAWAGPDGAGSTFDMKTEDISSSSSDFMMD
jgi:tetratricopeptide (TPR) repeat protein